VLVIGIGNTLRSDDGVGPYIAQLIEAKGLKGVKVWVTQQLHVEDIDGMLVFSKIILIDAAVEGVQVSLRRIHSNDTAGRAASSHHLSAGLCLDMARQIFHKTLNIELCSIRGSNFEFGDKLSAHVLSCVDQAVELICSSIKQA
ncbi:MAG: hydrogenase maturation protease, partial [Candidatus Omnitrophica bacterium]|nr:hydrogenase maturation protease [Candidatus Omnitrophota bacterium]